MILTNDQKVIEANKHRALKIKLEAAFTILLLRLLRQIATQLALEYAKGKTLQALQFEKQLYILLFNQYTRINKKVTNNLINASSTASSDKINNTAFSDFNYLLTTMIYPRILLITATTQKDIHNAISRYVDLGYKDPKLLKNLFLETSAYRSALISITETNNAVELKKSTLADKHLTFGDHILNKTWITILDGKERPWHGDVFGQTVPIDKLFTVNDELLRYPGDINYGATPSNICNCRCSAIYDDGQIISSRF